MEFKDFEIDPRAIRVIDEQGLTTPTPIQEKAIPAALEGRDIVAIAQTGTGKTLAFALPTLTRLAQTKITPNRVLILTPTRELAVQVHGVVHELAKAMKIRATCVYGGAAMNPQVQALRKGSAVIVATPGRLLDHLSRGNVRFNELDTLIFDEADRMLDMGFLPDIKELLKKLPSDRQTMMFSATFPDEINSLARQFMRDPEWISVGPVSKPVDAVRQTLYPVFPQDKYTLLQKVLEDKGIRSALVFARTKQRTDHVTKLLRSKGYKATGIHGDRSQALRERALEGFRNGKYKILVATDVAARGLDVEGISHVINFDIPENPEDYLHRIGRTARAQADGDAITFVTPTDADALAGIERKVGRNLPQEEWDRAAPILRLWHAPNGQDGKKAARRRSAPRRRSGGRMLRRR